MVAQAVSPAIFLFAHSRGSLSVTNRDCKGREPELGMIRKISGGKFRLYSRKKTTEGKRKNLGTFDTREAAEKHEREVQYFKRR